MIISLVDRLGWSLTTSLSRAFRINTPKTEKKSRNCSLPDLFMLNSTAQHKKKWEGRIECNWEFTQWGNSFLVVFLSGERNTQEQQHYFNGKTSNFHRKKKFTVCIQWSFRSVVERQRISTSVDDCICSFQLVLSSQSLRKCVRRKNEIRRQEREVEVEQTIKSQVCENRASLMKRIKV